MVTTIRCGDRVFEHIQAVIFDKDGTLANSEAFLRDLAQWRSHLINAQVPGIQDDLLRSFGAIPAGFNPAGLMAVGSREQNKIAAAAYIAATGRDWVEALDIVQAAFTEADCQLKRKAEFTPLFAGSLELLNTLNAADLTLGLLSSDITENVRDFVQLYHLEDYFQVILGVNGKPPKPDPTLLYEMCEKLAIAPQHVLVVGDATVDMRMGHLAGVAGCIGVTWGWTKAVLPAEADVIVSQFDQIQVSACRHV